jgi:hypothetical protein
MHQLVVIVKLEGSGVIDNSKRALGILKQFQKQLEVLAADIYEDARVYVVFFLNLSYSVNFLENFCRSEFLLFV